MQDVAKKYSGILEAVFEEICAEKSVLELSGFLPMDESVRLETLDKAVDYCLDILCLLIDLTNEGIQQEYEPLFLLLSRLHLNRFHLL